MGRMRRILVLAVSASFVLSACAGTATSPSPATSAAPPSQAPASAAAPSAGAEMTTVRLQLQWYPQAQFAGYFAAIEQGYYAAENLDVRWVPAAATIAPADGRLAAGWPGVHDRLAAQGPAGPRGGLEPRQHRPDLPALRHAVGLVEGIRTSPAPADFKGKKVGVWDFGNEFEVTAGAQEGRARAGHRLHEGHPGLRHGAAPAERDRRLRGDDLQRVRPGARSDQPGDRRAVPADRPQRHQLERRGLGDAPGRAVRTRGLAGPARQRGHRDPLHQGVVPGLDLLPRQPGRLHPVHVDAGSTSWAPVTRRG